MAQLAIQVMLLSSYSEVLAAVQTVPAMILASSLFSMVLALEHDDLFLLTLVAILGNGPSHMMEMLQRLTAHVAVKTRFFKIDN